jgi:hypothetical protein
VRGRSMRSNSSLEFFNSMTILDVEKFFFKSLLTSL